MCTQNMKKKYKRNKYHSTYRSSSPQKIIILLEKLVTIQNFYKTEPYIHFKTRNGILVEPTIFVHVLQL